MRQILKYGKYWWPFTPANVQTLQLCLPVQGYLQWKLARKITKTRQLSNTILPIATVLIRKRTKRLLASLTACRYSAGILILSKNSRQVYPLKNSIVCILACMTVYIIPLWCCYIVQKILLTLFRVSHFQLLLFPMYRNNSVLVRCTLFRIILNCCTLMCGTIWKH